MRGKPTISCAKSIHNDMAESTGIPYARSTRNFWSGCTKTGPGCDGCYAEAFQRFVRGKNSETGQAVNWGPGQPRIPHLEGAAKDLRRWNRKTLAEARDGATWNGLKGFWPVFVNTQSDTFDNEVPQAWRDFAFSVMEECAALTIYLVTKRIGNVPRMVPERWMREGFPAHIRLLITVVNQEEADRDVPKLLALPCSNGISYEPAIGPVDWTRIGSENRGYIDALRGARHLEWVIAGGESDQSTHKARAFNLDWARDTVAQCTAAGVAVYVKQLGSHVVPSEAEGNQHRITFGDRAGGEPSEWPADMRVRLFPEVRTGRATACASDAPAVPRDVREGFPL